ncbi:MAG: pyridoxal-phosphate dependent enzyme [Frankiaceae bacterium]|nr:pyridoxal-phosphate dependent enzyme [Frankiaceae bacterium]
MSSDLTPDAVAAAAARIHDLVRHTPLWEVELRGRRLLLKAEHMQRSGSFKFRGASHATLRAQGRGATTVVTASGGNHGLAVAVAAAALGMQADVFVPAAIPPDKLGRIRLAGARVVEVDGDYQDAADAAADHAERNALPYVSAFDQPDVIAGQGTAITEVLAERPDCDAVVVAVGGGGLLAGAALASAGRVAVFGAEPEGIPTVTQALAAGEPVDVTIDSVTASALGARRTSAVNLGVLREWPVTMGLVSDSALLRARDELWEEHRIAVEPAAGAALALALDGPPLGVLPCVVLCGANSGWTSSPPAP